MEGPLPWQQNQLTDAHYHKGSHPIEDAQVLDTEDHVVQEERHQATEADAGNPKEGQEHWAGQGAPGMELGDPTEHSLSVCGPGWVLPHTPPSPGAPSPPHPSPV